MSHDRFEAAVAMILVSEGGHTIDTGGDTWYGIARKFHPDVTPWPPTKAQAVAIYREEYWDRYHCGDLPWPVDAALFDSVVNQPAVAMIQELQLVLHVNPDGIIGAETIAAAERRDPWEIVALFFTRRALRYIQRSPDEYKIGLVARLFRTQKMLLSASSLV